ncbi:10578_t:CDS:2, partial [Funneliformis caledonium]
EQTKIEEISLPSDLTYPKRYIYIIVLCFVLDEEVTDRFIFDISVEMWTFMKISHLQDGSSSVLAKRQGESQDYNHKSVAPSVTDFWNKLSEAQIILKFPKDFNKTAFTPSKYMKIEIVLDSDVMLNAQDELIFNDSKPVLESVESLNFVKFLRFCESPDGIVYGIKTWDILIKKSYLQMIEKLKTDRIKEEIKGCTIVGSPSIGKTHYSLYLAFYITYRYSSTDFVYQQLNEGKSYTLHINQKNKSTHPRNYYAPIWTEEEIWSVWNWNNHYKNKISETRVKELIERWGCILRRVFVEYNDEPDLDRLLSRCNIHKYLQNDGTGLHDNYSGKIIHIIPNDDFTKKEYASVSYEISKALYNYYAKNTRETIIKIIRDFAKTASGPLAGKLFEMMAHDIL